MPELFKDLPPLGDASAADKMTAPGTIGGMFSDAARKVSGFFETPPPAPPAPAPVVVPYAPGAEPAPPPAASAPQQAAPLAAPQTQTQTQQDKQPQPMQEQTSTTYTSGIKLPEALKTQQNDALQAKGDAEIAQNQAQAEAARNQALIIEQKNFDMQKRQEQDAAAAQEIKNKADQAQNAWMGAIDDFKKNSKVDPDRLDKERGVGGGILAALAQGLGAFGSALTHTPNYAAQILKDAVDRDVRAQEHAIEQKRDAVGLQGNIVQHFRQQGLDQESAARAAKMTILDQAQGKLDALTATSKNDDILARAETIRAGILAEKSNLANQNYVNAQGKFVKQTMSAPAQPMSVENQLRVEGLNVYVPQTAKDPKTGEMRETGEYKTYRASSEDDAKKIKQAMVVRDHIKANLQRMGTLVDETTFKSLPGTTGHVQINTLADTLRTQFGVLHNLGALSDKDYTIASQLGDPTSFFQRDSVTKQLIGQFGTDIDNMVNSEMKARGLFR